MGGLNNFYSFFSNRVLPQSPPSPQSTNSDKENLYHAEYSQQSKRRSYSDASPALAHKEQTIHQLYPYEDRHSFNPHYQHNLHTQSSSPAYSTPPSLSSSPTNSSPSSITSSGAPSSASSSLSPMTAKQSLMRVAQCDIRQDGWCSQQSGQWSRHYAETHSRGMMTDGRRARRM
ncbi:hypothetical protein KVV02_001565 [Mortierella alpina]|uniref:Uncharacterized protein n=1 Tax=Mortierella alpina TaxID=64518 RepID=A0A9P8D1Q0_MORAP|nr:hypothetical protein KVV02_001565 [Mortierella alpina]